MQTWRKDAIGMTVLALIVWVVFIVVWCEAAWSAAHHLSGTDWRGNHRTKQHLLLAALAVFGLPPLGAVLGWVWGPLASASKRPAWCTAAGFLSGALGLAAIAVIGFLVALYRTLDTL
ncbi:hypothetical protein ACIBF1_30030 [Spirillospora sp. NPDC050679]